MDTVKEKTVFIARKISKEENLEIPLDKEKMTLECMTNNLPGKLEKLKRSRRPNKRVNYMNSNSRKNYDDRCSYNNSRFNNDNYDCRLDEERINQNERNKENIPNTTGCGKIVSSNLHTSNKKNYLKPKNENNGQKSEAVLKRSNIDSYREDRFKSFNKRNIKCHLC